MKESLEAAIQCVRKFTVPVHRVQIDGTRGEAVFAK